jgi:hypothetical protein
VTASRPASAALPIDSPSVRALAVEVWRRAEAMGLVDASVRRLEAPDVTSLLGRLRQEGIARAPALHFDNVEIPSVAEAERLLNLVIAALDASPVPAREWPVLTGVLEPERLAALLGISVSSLRRYASGERDTPDDIAARLHHLALIVGDLAGAYNDVGVRRWFERRRTALGGKSPAMLFAGDWSPEDEDPTRVRDLARSLVSLSVT